MKKKSQLIAAMAEECKRVLQDWNAYDSRFPPALQQKHLLWMCDRIQEHAASGPVTRLHRWIGFIQGAMLAHGILDLAELKEMFDDAKAAYGKGSEEIEDLLDHCDPDNPFELDLGGQG